MPKFRLRIWRSQTLYDSQDYEVEADTIERAAARLAFLEEDSENSSMSREGVRCLGIGRANNERDQVWELDPEEIVDGESGVAEIDAKGDKIRDIEFDPDDRLEEPEPPKKTLTLEDWRQAVRGCQTMLGFDDWLLEQ